ncbi:MAG: peptidylprolyl isomerase [Candidatus Omnitrophica bacterium]|nr:peptidylprolyl isomerase [Candidatus Omnitrophota bacterium]
MNNKTIVFLFFVLFTVPCFAGTLDKIIVVVNGETITQGELDDAVASVAERIQKQIKDPAQFAAEIENQRKVILNRMIDERLILSEAKKKGMKANDAAVEEKLNAIRSQMGSESKFLEALRAQDISLNDLKKRYADQILISELADMEIRRKIIVTPSDISGYYEAHKADFQEPEKVHLKNILIKPGEGLTGQEAYDLAEKVKAFLKAGENFDELAIKYSKGPNADRGGDLGFVGRGEMMKEIEDAVFKLEPGQVSDVIETKLGYHIFKVEEKKAAQAKPLSEVKDDIEKTIYIGKAKARYDEWLAELKKNAYISYRQ